MIVSGHVFHAAVGSSSCCMIALCKNPCNFVLIAADVRSHVPEVMAFTSIACVPVNEAGTRGELADMLAALNAALSKVNGGVNHASNVRTLFLNAVLSSVDVPT